jgi:hypothetical protein
MRYARILSETYAGSVQSALAGCCCQSVRSTLSASVTRSSRSTCWCTKVASVTFVRRAWAGCCRADRTSRIGFRTWHTSSAGMPRASRSRARRLRVPRFWPRSSCRATPTASTRDPWLVRVTRQHHVGCTERSDGGGSLTKPLPDVVHREDVGGAHIDWSCRCDHPTVGFAELATDRTAASAECLW